MLSRTPRNARPLAALLGFCALLAQSSGCGAAQSDLALGDGGEQQPTLSASNPLLITFTWEHAVAGCEGGQECRQMFRMAGAGAMVDDDRGHVRSVRARSEDYEAFAAVATDRAVLDALRESTECAPGENPEQDRLVIEVASETPVESGLQRCTSATHVRVRAAVERLRAAYFPSET